MYTLHIMLRDENQLTIFSGMLYLSYLDYSREITMVDIRAAASSADIDRYMVGYLGEVFIKIFELMVAVLNVP